MSPTKKEYKQLQVWSETHTLLNELAKHYSEEQEKEYGTKAKKVSMSAVIDQLVKMKTYEITKGN